MLTLYLSYTFECCDSLFGKPQTRHFPIIVGDHYELAETVDFLYTGEDQAGLLAKAEYVTALLPMSGYEKPQDANANEYDARRPSQAYSSLAVRHARRPSQDPMYLQNALPGAADPQLQQPSTAYDRQTDHMNYGGSPIYQPRATFEATPSAYQDFETPRILRVSHNPPRGTKGALLYIYLDSTSDLLPATPSTVTLMFGSRSVPASLTRLEAPEQDVYYRYMVSAIAPAFSETGSSILRIPLCLQVQEQSKLDARQVDAGSWLYEDGKQLEYRSSPQEVSRKRKVTDEPSDTPRSTKRITPLEQQTSQSQEYESYPYPSASLAYPQSLQHDLNTMQRKYTAYGRSQLQQSLQSESNTVGSQGLISGASTSQSLMRPPTGQTPSWISSYGAEYQSGRNPLPNAAPSFQVSSLSSPSPSNPQLVRSSTLAPQPSPSTASAGSSSDRKFNPYTLYPNRAVLEVRGNLSAMQESWTPEERAAKRRIVRFWGEQNGTNLNAYFNPVKADGQPLAHEPYETCISCIYWEERDEYYITSVDTIFILESLVATKFSIEEKNRIRRNLEGFKPCTVSKGKPESESLFKLIMGLLNPKPRVISKDVKVFHWPILEQALKKIISKYSADPSSIVGPRGRQSRNNFSGPQSEAGAGRYSDLSSRSMSGSAVSGAYAPTLKSSPLSPPPASHGLSRYSQASPLQRLSAPSLSHSYTVPTLGSPYMPNDTSNSPYAVQVSIPNLSSAYTASTVGSRRSSDAPTDDTLALLNQHSWLPHTRTSFASPYAPQESSEATAPVGLPGGASEDLSAYLNTNAASWGSIGDAQYRRQSGVDDETEVTHFKEE